MSRSFAETGLDRSLPHIGVIMEKKDTDRYPRFQLPKGYSFSSYQPGFEEQWAELQFCVEQVDSLEEAKSMFLQEFLLGKQVDWTNSKANERSICNPEKYPCFDEMCRRVVFVVDSGRKVVGAGAIWKGNIFKNERQRIHCVAVQPEYQNQGIAKALLTKLLDVYNELDDRKYLYLTSQTWSYKAIGLYSKFGFQPYLGDQPENWKSVNFTSGKFEPIDYKAKNREAWDMIDQKIREYNGRS